MLLQKLEHFGFRGVFGFPRKQKLVCNFWFRMPRKAKNEFWCTSGFDSKTVWFLIFINQVALPICLKTSKNTLFAQDTTVCTEKIPTGQQFTQDLSATRSWFLEIGTFQQLQKN